jgi:FkbM family methyltransferase
VSAHRFRTAAFNCFRRIGSSAVGPAATRLAFFAVAGLRNQGADLERNGEYWLLNTLSSLNPKVVFDVGANVGLWTLGAVRNLRDVQVHAFEPIPATFERLCRQVESHTNVVPNNVALADRTMDQLEMWVPTNFAEASAVRPEVGSGSTLVKATTGDLYMHQHGIDHIDILKLDVEGLEWEVLAGFAESLQARTVEVLQFEYTTWQAVPTRRWLGDYVRLLESLDFSVGKLLSAKVDFHPYSLNDEQFPGGNYVAVRRGSKAETLLRGTAAR